jgi:hypothetical protein
MAKLTGQKESLSPNNGSSVAQRMERSQLLNITTSKPDDGRTAVSDETKAFFKWLKSRIVRPGERRS